MLKSDRYESRSERAAAIQSMGILLEQRKQQQSSHRRDWSTEGTWTADGYSNNNVDENNGAIGTSGPKSILKGNLSDKKVRDLNNNLVEQKEEIGQRYAAKKKDLRWKEKNQQQQNIGQDLRKAEEEGDDTLHCCSICGGRIYAGDCHKSAMFGGGQALLVHWACFQCATCGLDLGKEVEERVFKWDGRFYCQVHGPTAQASEQKRQQKYGQQEQRKWWERSADEFNGNKQSSSTTIRYYGHGAERENSQPKMAEKLLKGNDVETELSKKNNGTKKWVVGKNQSTAKELANNNNNCAVKNWTSSKNCGKTTSTITSDSEQQLVDCCEHCGIELSGSFVLAKGRAWCPEHFCCANSACARPLLNTGFVNDAASKRNYCPKCYEVLIAPVCHKCSLPLTESCLNAMGHKWHSECFCCTHCLKPFGSMSFFVENGKPYCEDDWNKLFTTKCYECQCPIKVGQKWLDALGGRSFHANCFKCTTCHIVLEGKTFFERDNRPYCRAHAPH